KEIADSEDPVPWISKRLKAGRIGQSEVYEVSFLTREPETAKKVVEAIVDTYMSFQTGETDAQRTKMLETLQDELKRLNTNIEQKRKNLREIAQSVVGDDIPVINLPNAAGGPTVSGQFDLLRNLQQKLVQAEVDIEISKARVAALSPRQQ